MRTSLLAAAAALGAALLIAAPAAADTTPPPSSSPAATLTGVPACRTDGSGNIDVSWTGRTTDVPAHDQGQVTITGHTPAPVGVGTGTSQPTPNPVPADGAFTISQFNIPGADGYGTASITVRIDWAPTIDPTTGLPYPDGVTYSASFTGTVELPTGCVPTARPPAFSDQQSCANPAVYILYTRTDVAYRVNGAPVGPGGYYRLPANFTGTLAVEAYDAARGPLLGAWSHTFAPTAVSSCVQLATVKITAKAGCGTVTGTLAVSTAGVITSFALDDVVSGLPLAGTNYTVRPGQTLAFTYKLIPASRPAGPDTVYVSVASDHQPDGGVVTLAVPHGSAAHPQTCTTLTAPAGQRHQPVARRSPISHAAAGPVLLASTGGPVRVPALLGMGSILGGALLAAAGRR